MPNDMLQDKSISHKARGVLCYLLSKPDNWLVRREDLRTEKDGEASIRSALQELRDAGYIRWEPIRKNGRIVQWQHDVYDHRGNQYEEILDVGNQHEENPHAYKRMSLQKTEKNKKKNRVSTDDIDSTNVLEHLNRRTGKGFRNQDTIKARLNNGCTVEECHLVIDWWAEVYIQQNPDMVQYFDNTTLFRPRKFDTYRAKAEAWDLAGRPSAGNADQLDGMLARLAERGAIQ